MRRKKKYLSRQHNVPGFQTDISELYKTLLIVVIRKVLNNYTALY